MKTPTKPYHLGKTLAVGLALALAFSLLSLFLLLVQARNSQMRLAGEVIFIDQNRLTIQNAHGERTDLIVPADAYLHGVSSVDAIVKGQHIMTKGNFSGDMFEVERLRLLRLIDRK